MKEEDTSPVSSPMLGNLAGISTTRQRYPSPMPYPYFGHSFTYLPWELMAGFPSFSLGLDPRWQTAGRAKCEEIKHDSDGGSKTLVIPKISNSNSSKTGPTSSLINFSIEDILNRREPQMRKMCLPNASYSSLSEAMKSNTSESDAEILSRSLEENLIEPSRYSWLHCTRYRPPKLPRIKKKETGKKRKLGRNPRVPFTQHQVSALEHKFHRTHYLSSADVAELSTALNLTETRVKIWFQNRRARERRDRDGIQRSERSNGPTAASSANTFHMPSILTWSPSLASSTQALPPLKHSPIGGAKSAFKPTT